MTLEDLRNHHQEPHENKDFMRDPGPLIYFMLPFLLHLLNEGGFFGGTTL